MATTKSTSKTKSHESFGTRTVTPKISQQKLRKIKLPPYNLFRLVPRIKHPVKLPSTVRIIVKTYRLIWNARKPLLGIIVIYGVLSIIFVRGLGGGTDVDALKRQFQSVLGGNIGQISVGLSVFTALLASSGNSTSSTAGSYQFFLVVFVSLAIIWALRQVTAGERIRIRDAFYKGLYPIVPFMLVLLAITLQTVPFLIGGTLWVITVSNGIAVLPIEKVLWTALFILLSLVSIYMLCSSIFAAYIVTLPEMTPMKALRSARKLVQYRRLSIFRKLFFLPIILLVISVIIMLPVIIFAAPLAPWVFFLLGMVGLVAVHAYLYTLYRELLA